MDQITDKSIEREAKALKLVYGFDDYLFTELSAKFEFDAGYSKFEAEKLALDCIKSIYRP